MSKILVTGGAGFIGSNFLNLLVPRHPEHTFINVDALTYAANLKNVASLVGALNYKFVHADIRNLDSMMTIFEEHKPDLVVHFAAESHVDRSIDGPRTFVETNVMGTLNLLEGCRKHSPNCLFHHVSTDEVYGSLGETGYFTESTRYDPSSPYSASKAASDHLVRAYARTYGLNMKITNCSNNYGPYQFPEKLIPLTISRIVQRQPIPVYGTGKNVRDWLYVTDHCEAIWTVINRGRTGETYNVGGRAEARNIDIVTELCLILSEEMGTDVRHLLSLITHVPDRPGHDFRYAIDSTKLEIETGWRPSETLQSGLRKTVRWYLENPERFTTEEHVG